jgi:tetratricopeptide (TPR) repeat protein
MRIPLTLLLLLSFACAPAGPSTLPNDREWSLLSADYQWIETLRSAQPKPAAYATRKEQIEIALQNLQKLEPAHRAFMDKLTEYHQRTSDPRAAAVMAREKIVLGDVYMSVLSRYDKAISLYREALEIEPENPHARERITLGEERRFVSLDSFSAVKQGMKEDEVRRLVGLPREDWIRQVIQNRRVYSVWIYPKSDGGASAIYFDNGVVYHTNWNAAAPSGGRE